MACTPTNKRTMKNICFHQALIMLQVLLLYLTLSNGSSSEGSGSGGSGSSWSPPKDAKVRAAIAAQKAQQGEGTRVISNFIQNATLLQELTDHYLWFKCYKETRGSNTHWLDRDAVPKTWMEKLAVQMWKDQPMTKYHKDFAGYEIWCNILTPEGPLDWHVDKDQIAHKESGDQNLSYPLYGSVFYGYPHEFDGGFLEVVKYDPSHGDDISLDEDEMERIDAEYNRLILFNASKFHRVAPIHSGVRITLAVNVWKDKPRVADLEGANLQAKKA